MWFRVDNRLIHGQVIEGWLPYTGAAHLIVANDALAKDLLRQQIMSLAIPHHVDVRFVPLKDLAGTLKECGDESFVLFENLQDVRTAARSGVTLNVLNIGNLHYGAGKKQLCTHVAVSEDDMAALRELVSGQGTELDFRAVPLEPEKIPDEFVL